MNFKEIIVTVVAVFLAVIAGGFIVAGLVGGNQQLGNGTASFWDAAEGFRVDGTTVIDGTGNVDAPITSSTGTFSSTLGVTGDFSVDTSDFFVDVSATSTGIGTTTPLDLVHAENQYATSTLIISSGASAVGGRIILEDHDGAGCSEIAILNGTVAAKTVTCPTGI